MAKQCSIKGCGKVNHSRTWCKKHYSRWKKYGSPMIQGTRRPAIRYSLEAFDKYLRAAELSGEGVHFTDPGKAAIRRARQNGYFTEEAADKIACVDLHIHPAVIWGDDWFWPVGAA